MLPDPKKKYTFTKYISFKKFKRKEIIDGDLIKYEPPRRIHQKVCLAMAAQFYTLLENTPYEVYTAPFTVRMYGDDGRDMRNCNIVVQPDISVICDRSKLDIWGCNGAPDLIVEVLDHSKKIYDTNVKHTLYTDTGVREYWIADPDSKTVEVHYRDENDHLSTVRIYTSEEKAKINILQDTYTELFSDCSIDLSRVFR
ncbi:MAG: Uma2 family endonuclease [Lachnospiraceae bacterium]|nr:Uma2 family endonuclease [Ruminococcus sp.]MCM1276998.1 Uma2 family endonuclease [Lachnospiraceae bacterium]